MDRYTMKAIHVKTQTDYENLMKELEKLNYRWTMDKATSRTHFKNYKEDTIIYCYEKKYLSYGNIKNFSEKRDFTLVDYNLKKNNMECY